VNHLLLWALWSCGRRVRVAQAKRQIHGALPAANTITGGFLSPIAQQAPFCPVDLEARALRRGREDHSPRGFSPPPLEATLECPQLPVRVDARMLGLQPLEQFATGPLRLGLEPLPKHRPAGLKRVT